MTTKSAPTPAALKESLAELNRMVFGADSKMQLELVDFDQVREQDVNANAMPPDMFAALVSNIEKNEQLESVPLCATREGSDQVEIVSGHHRIRAARRAGRKAGLALVYHGLTDSEIKAKQLAHNSINGSSDPQLVLDIYNSISDLSAKIESFIDPAQLEEAAKPPSVSFTQLDVDITTDMKSATFAFLPTQLEDVDKAIQALNGDPDVLYLGARETFDAFRDAVQRTRMDTQVFSLPAAITAMSHFVLRTLDEINVEKLREEALEEEKKRGRSKGDSMPIASILGADRMPLKESRRVQAMLDKLAAAEGWSQRDRWKALVKLADLLSSGVAGA